AEMLKVHPQTLRFYEKKGLVRPSRTEGQTRMYSAEDVEDLARLLRLTRDLGVNLAGVEIIIKMRRRMIDMQKQIEDLLGYVRDEGGTPPVRRDDDEPRAARVRAACGPPGRVVPGAEESGVPALEAEALARSAASLFQKVLSLTPTLPDELASIAADAENPGAVADLIAGALTSLALPLRQALLAAINVKERLARLVTALGKEAEVLELGSKIQSEIQSEMSKTQREYYLREQLKAIQKELGDSDERTQEIDALRAKVEAAGMTEEARKEALRELDR